MPLRIYTIYFTLSNYYLFYILKNQNRKIIKINLLLNLLIKIIKKLRMNLKSFQPRVMLLRLPRVVRRLLMFLPIQVGQVLLHPSDILLGMQEPMLPVQPPIEVIPIITLRAL